MSRIYRFAEIEVRVSERALLSHDGPIALGGRAFDVLLALIEHRNRVVTKDELMDVAWPGVVVEENNLQVQVSTLRKLLGANAIVTIPGRGYQFVLEVTESDTTQIDPGGGAPLPGPQIASEAAEVATPTTPPLKRAPPKALLRTRGAVATVAYVVAALLGVGGYWIYDKVYLHSMATSARSIAAQGAPLSIAVLPFVNRTGDPQQEYIADGFTESLASSLYRLQDVSALSAATAFSFKGQSPTLSQVGKDLGVRFVLQGSVQRSGNKLRINAQLGDTATDSQLWSDSFDGLETDLFSLQDLITRRIGNSIRREMVIAAARDSERRTTSEGVADLLLRASALWIKPPWSLETLQKIEGLYRQALSAEPNNASVMVRLAFALTFQATDHRAELTAVDREGKLEEAYRLATSAQSIDPGNPDASSILGVYAYEHDDFEGYRRGAEAAASLSPMRQDYQEALANMLVAAGEPKRAIETLTKLMEAQSRHHSDWVYEDLGQAYFMLGDDSTALLHFQKAVEQNPAEPAYRADLAMAYADSGDTSKAHTELTEMLRIDPHFVFSKPIPSAPAPAHEYWEKRFLPAAKKAGVPVE